MSAWELRTGVSLDEVNLHLVALEEAGLLGIVEEGGRATVYLSARADVPLAGEWEEVEERDWNAVWKADVTPVTVGRITIVPPWLDPPARAEIVLVIEPGQAFGTGHHETTTGCLAALQEVDLMGRSVLDVGTGTGILAIAAARLGAVPVVAVDIDPLAIATATANARLNGCAVDVRSGSVDAAAGARFDAVVANLDTDTLCGLARALSERLAAAGTLIASGISRDRAAEAVRALRNAALTAQIRGTGEWVTLVGGRAR